MLFSVDSPFDFIFSPGLSLNLNLITIRKRDDIYLTLQGTPLMMNAMGIDSVWAFDVDFGAGYNFRISDRFIVAAEGYGGGWTKPASKSSVSKDKKIPGASGIAFGGRLSGNYYISSALKASFFAGYKNYYYKPTPFMNGIEAGLGISYNFTKGLFAQSSLKVNTEKNAITDVSVSVLIEQFMTISKEVAFFDKIEIGQEFCPG